MVDERVVLEIFSQAIRNSQVLIPREVRMEIQIQILITLRKKPSYNLDEDDDYNYAIVRDNFSKFVNEVNRIQFYPRFETGFEVNKVILDSVFYNSIRDRICPMWPIC